MTFKPWTHRVALALGLALSLSACAPVLVGGAMGGGVLVVTDRRTSGSQLEDESIELKGNARMRDEFGDRAHINVNSYNRQVLLTGQVKNEQDRTYAMQLAQRLDNVKTVINELEIGLPTSLATRSKDLLVSTKVRATFVDSKDLFANAFSVTTENGVVYLMGRVTAREAQSATDLVRTISGVRKVVRAFEVISEEELRRMMPPPPKPAEVKKIN
jgi:osmotically-inducible protein OsmY